MYSLRVYVDGSDIFAGEQDFQCLENAVEYIDQQCCTPSGSIGFALRNPSGWPGLIFFPWTRIREIHVIQIQGV